MSFQVLTTVDVQYDRLNPTFQAGQ